MAYTFDFTGGSLPTGATVARASVGYALNASGVLTSYANNVARFDYSTSASLLGLLLEPTATNLLTYSEQFDNAAWGKNLSSITANAATSPDGNATTDKFIATTANGSHNLINYSSSAPAANVISVYAKAAGYNWIILQGAGGGYVFFDVLDGVVGSAFSASGTIVPVGNGWFRCTLFSSVASSAVDIYLSNANAVFNFAGDGTSGVYLWGGDMEAGSVLSSYIQTSSAAAARAAETLNLNWGAQSIPDGACFHRITFDDLSTQLLAGTVVSGIAAIVAIPLARSHIRKVDYILAPTPAANRRVTLSDNFS